MTIRLTLRIDFADGTRLGHGKIRLLEEVQASGSILGASRTLGMSYRRAWQLVASLNSMFAEPVMVAQHGGRHGGGARLTEFGASLVARYRQMEAKALNTFADDLQMVEMVKVKGEACPQHHPSSRAMR